MESAVNFFLISTCFLLAYSCLLLAFFLAFYLLFTCFLLAFTCFFWKAALHRRTFAASTKKKKTKHVSRGDVSINQTKKNNKL